MAKPKSAQRRSRPPTPTYYPFPTVRGAPESAGSLMEWHERHAGRPQSAESLMAWHERQQAEALVQSYNRIKQRWQGGESISPSQRRFIDRLETAAAAAPGGWDLLAGARSLGSREANPKAIRRLKNSLLR